MTVRFEYPTLFDQEGRPTTLLYRRESDLPPDWNEQVVASFDIIGSYFGKANEADEVKKTAYAAIDDLVASIILKRGFSEVLEFGTGDGNRLLSIQRRSGKILHLMGTELGDGLIVAAKQNGIDVLKHNIRNPQLPIRDGSVELLVYSNNVFGYVVDQVRGEQLRAEVLSADYRALKPGGILFLELINLDYNDHYDHPGRVAYFERILFVGDKKEVGPLPFYTKMFRFKEVGKLVRLADISDAKITIQFMATHDYTHPRHLEKTVRNGEMLNTLNKFDGPEVESVLAYVTQGLRYGIQHNMLITVEKP